MAKLLVKLTSKRNLFSIRGNDDEDSDDAKLLTEPASDNTTTSSSSDDMMIRTNRFAAMMASRRAQSSRSLMEPSSRSSVGRRNSLNGSMPNLREVTHADDAGETWASTTSSSSRSKSDHLEAVAATTLTRLSDSFSKLRITGRIRKTGNDSMSDDDDDDDDDDDSDEEEEDAFGVPSKCSDSLSGAGFAELEDLDECESICSKESKGDEDDNDDDNDDHHSPKDTFPDLPPALLFSPQTSVNDDDSSCHFVNVSQRVSSHKISISLDDVPQFDLAAAHLVEQHPNTIITPTTPPITTITTAATTAATTATAIAKDTEINMAPTTQLLSSHGSKGFSFSSCGGGDHQQDEDEGEEEEEDHFESLKESGTSPIPQDFAFFEAFTEDNATPHDGSFLSPVAQVPFHATTGSDDNDAAAADADAIYNTPMERLDNLSYGINNNTSAPPPPACHKGGAAAASLLLLDDDGISPMTPHDGHHHHYYLPTHTGTIAGPSQLPTSQDLQDSIGMLDLMADDEEEDDDDEDDEQDDSVEMEEHNKNRKMGGSSGQQRSLSSLLPPMPTLT